MSLKLFAGHCVGVSSTEPLENFKTLQFLIEKHAGKFVQQSDLKNVTLFIANPNDEDLEYYLILAKEAGIPVVSSQFIWDSIQKKQLQDFSSYAVVGGKRKRSIAQDSQEEDKEEETAAKKQKREKEEERAAAATTTTATTATAVSSDASFEHGVVFIPAILNAQECSDVIARAESLHFQETTVGSSSTQSNVINKQQRNNQKVSFDDEQLAAQVWQRVQKYIAPKLGERLVAEKIDSNWKVYKYNPGEFFKSHTDSAEVKQDGSRTRVTLMIYLSGVNDGLEGGETVFYVPGSKVPLKFFPMTGCGLGFLHQIEHEAAPVTKGVKYVLRSNVLYKPTTPGAPAQQQSSSLQSNKSSASPDFITVTVEDQEFKVPNKTIEKYPNSLFYKLLHTSMNAQGENQETVFPSRNKLIFEKFVMPYLEGKQDLFADYIQQDVEQVPKHLLKMQEPSDPSLSYGGPSAPVVIPTRYCLTPPAEKAQWIEQHKDAIDEEFKFWGLLSPFDPLYTVTVLSHDNPKNDGEISQVLKASLQHLDNSLEAIQTHKKMLHAIDGARTATPLHPLVVYLSNKYSMFNEFIGEDKRLYDFCVEYFGKENVKIQHFRYVMDLKAEEEHNSKIYYWNLKPNTQLVEGRRPMECMPNSAASFPYYLQQMYGNMPTWYLSRMKEEKYEEEEEEMEDDDDDDKEEEGEGKKKEKQDTDDHLVHIMEPEEIKQYGVYETSFQGQYNDEYYPSYDVYTVVGLVITPKTRPEALASSSAISEVPQLPTRSQVNPFQLYMQSGAASPNFKQAYQDYMQLPPAQKEKYKQMAKEELADLIPDYLNAQEKLEQFINVHCRSFYPSKADEYPNAKSSK